MIKHLKVILLIISVTFFQTTPSYANEEVSVSGISYDEIYDPIEPINRAVLNFNFFIDDITIRPIVKTYKFIAPEPVEKGVSNFFSNLKDCCNQTFALLHRIAINCNSLNYCNKLQYFNRILAL